MKNMIVNFNNRLNQAEEITCELEDRSLAIIQSEEKKEIRLKKSSESLFE